MVYSFRNWRFRVFDRILWDRSTGSALLIWSVFLSCCVSVAKVRKHHETEAVGRALVVYTFVPTSPPKPTEISRLEPLNFRSAHVKAKMGEHILPCIIPPAGTTSEA